MSLQPNGLPRQGTTQQDLGPFADQGPSSPGLLLSASKLTTSGMIGYRTLGVRHRVLLSSQSSSTPMPCGSVLLRLIHQHCAGEL